MSILVRHGCPLIQRDCPVDVPVLAEDVIDWISPPLILTVALEVNSGNLQSIVGSAAVGKDEDKL